MIENSCGSGMYIRPATAYDGTTDDEENSMKHIDFTKYVIYTADEPGTITITRAAEPQPCECCSEPAEYKLRSNWDVHGQCDVYECQSCLTNSMTDTDVPDVFELVAA